MNWWAHQDLNLGPKDYESPAEGYIRCNRSGFGYYLDSNKLASHCIISAEI